MSYPKAAAELNLSDKEEKAIHDTWGIISQDLRAAGVGFFLYFFGVYPKYQPMFKSFAKVPFAELAGNKRFQAHGFTVMNAINGFIESMDDIDMLRELLIKTGHNHARRKLTTEDFTVVHSSLMAFFGQELGDKFTPVVSGSWDKVLSAIVSIVNEGIDEYNTENSS